MGDPQWYKDAIIYEIHVRAFHDSNGDGIGDFKGLTQKLDYLQDLGITALWLLPFYPSPLKDDGYDIADYRNIHPSYGTMEDFREFLHEAHKRDLRVITELVINHTSDQHPWFQKSRRDKPGGKWRDFYVWSDKPDKYLDTRIIFQDFEHSNWAYDSEADAYYWHRFYSHQPDLNFDNPEVHQAVFAAMDYWLEMGVDGLRLDAIPYLYEREGTNCENLPETHEFLKELRAHVDANHENKMLLAEANQWAEDAASYFGDGDECHMNFHFPVMPRLYLGLEQEDRFPIVDILEQTPPIHESNQWALFLRNHDELTLEMVTDEERDYMYRTFAQHNRAKINLGIRRRLAPLLRADRRRIELMNVLLFALPGTPVLYYGDEIGMGDNFFLGDRNGVRTPMQWSGDRNAGFSRANPQQLFLPVIIDPEYHYEAVNVEVQQSNTSSLLWWMKRVIALRKQHPVFGRGEISFLHPANRRILAFIREFEDDRVLVVCNLSRFPQFCELDLSEFEGLTPVELFGQHNFPKIGELPYLLTLGPHSYHLFSLEKREESERPWALEGTSKPAHIRVPSGVTNWEQMLGPKHRVVIERALRQFVPGQRWFRSKSQRPTGVTIRDAIPFGQEGSRIWLTLFDVSFAQRDDETYVIPLGFASGEQADAVQNSHYAIIGRIEGGEGEPTGLLYDAFGDPDFGRLLLREIMGEASFRGSVGRVRGQKISDADFDVDDPELAARALQSEQSNTSIVYGHNAILKLYRKVEPGENPESELGQFLTEHDFEHAPKLLGALQYTQGKQRSTLGVVHGFVENEGDAWEHTLDELERFFEDLLARNAPGSPEETASNRADDLAANERLGNYLEDAQRLGERTAQMHCVLASVDDDEAFQPEPFSQLYQRSLYQAMRSLARQSLDMLEREFDGLPEAARDDARRVLDARDRIDRTFRSIVGTKIHASRIRIHGDYHLGQVLSTGRDFVITDFEGEPGRPITERRIKRSAVRDVAGMLRSFDYAAHSSLMRLRERGLIGGEKAGAELQRRADDWTELTRSAFIGAYREATKGQSFVPPDREHFDALVRVFLLEKAVYELAYELDNRPAWVGIPLRGILELIDDQSEAQ